MLELSRSAPSPATWNKARRSAGSARGSTRRRPPAAERRALRVCGRRPRDEEVGHVAAAPRPAPPAPTRRLFGRFFTRITSPGAHQVAGDVDAAAVDRDVAVARPAAGPGPRQWPKPSRWTTLSSRRSSRLISASPVLPLPLSAMAEIPCGTAAPARRSSASPSASRGGARRSRSACRGGSDCMPGGDLAALDGALRRIAARALEEQLHPLAAAQPANGSGVTSHTWSQLVRVR